MLPFEYKGATKIISLEQLALRRQQVVFVGNGVRIDVLYSFLLKVLSSELVGSILLEFSVLLAKTKAMGNCS